jgi:hypothetical protein
MNCSESINLLFDTIAEKNLEKCLKIVDYYLKKKYDRDKLIINILNYISEFYMTRNIWVVEKFVENIEQPTQILSILINIDKKALEIKSDKERIKKILKTNNYEHEILTQYKNLSNELYTLLNILYTNLMTHTNAKESLFIVTYMMKKQKNISDIIFNILIGGVENNTQCYIKYCKELFYYKCKPTDRIKRINFLNYAVYVFIQQEIYDYPLDITEIKERTPTDYLFVYFDRDLVLEETVQQDRDIYRENLKETEIKNVFYK